MGSCDMEAIIMFIKIMGVFIFGMALIYLSVWILMKIMED